MKRQAQVKRKTRETDISCKVNIDGTGVAKINTGIGFLDHLLTSFACHSRMDIDLRCSGDLQIDDHHTAEDCALVLGEAILQALGDKKGVVRFGYAYAPLDEALSRAVVDLSGRPVSVVNLDLKREKLGEIASENVTHVIQSLAVTLKASIHVDVLRGLNDHHRAESAFKALALALREAVTLDGSKKIRSTKGSL